MKADKMSRVACIIVWVRRLQESEFGLIVCQQSERTRERAMFQIVLKHRPFSGSPLSLSVRDSQ